MADFFDHPDRVPRDPEQDIEARRAWLRQQYDDPSAGPSFRRQLEMSRWLPAHHPSDAVIAATEGGTVVLNGVACCPWGFEFTIGAVPAPGRPEAMFWLEVPMFPAEALASMPPMMAASMLARGGGPGHFELAVHLNDGREVPVASLFEAFVPAPSSGSPGLPANVNRNGDHVDGEMGTTLRWVGSRVNIAERHAFWSA